MHRSVAAETGSAGLYENGQQAAANVRLAVWKDPRGCSFTTSSAQCGCVGRVGNALKGRAAVSSSLAVRLSRRLPAGTPEP